MKLISYTYNNETIDLTNAKIINYVNNPNKLISTHPPKWIVGNSIIEVEIEHKVASGAIHKSTLTYNDGKKQIKTETVLSLSQSKTNLVFVFNN